MPDLPISGLPVVTALSSSYLIPAVSGSVTAQMTLAQVGAAISGSYVTIDGTQTIAGSKTFSANQLILAPASSGGVLNLKQDAYLGSTNGYTSLTSDGTNIAIIAANGAITNKQAVLDLSSLTNNTLRTYTFPNKNGTVAMLSDITSSGTAFPYTGSAVISGSLNVIGSTNISGSFTVTGSIIGNVSASGQIVGASIGRFNNVLLYSTFASTGTGNLKIRTGNSVSSDDGSWNTAVGAGSFWLSAGGSRNTVFGVSASYFNGEGNDNVAIGYQALASNINSGSQNIAIGSAALYTGLTNNNIAIGYSASYNTTGIANIGIGTQTLQNLTTGTYNVAVGDGAMAGGGGPISGSSNIGIGAYALGNVRTGNGNIAMGDGTMQGLTSGSYNIGIGWQNSQMQINLGQTDSSGSGNIALGSYTFYSLGQGNENIALGSYALYGSGGAIRDASYNIALGYSASLNTTRAQRNITIGYSAGSSITTGNYNTILGSTTGSTTLTGTVLIADGQGNLAMKATGSAVTLYNILQLPTQHPLPAASSYPNSFAVSASSPTKPYYSDGTNWNALY